MLTRITVGVLATGLISACGTGAEAPPEPTGVVIEAPTTTAVAPATVAAPTTTSMPTTKAAPATTTTSVVTGEAVEGTFTFAAGEAGEVTFTVAGSVITLDQVEPADGWTHQVE
ncbi:MAG: hypothetical protein ACRDVM_07200, partial [Acidimicrobiia bacterium]